ncbi:hypothetical protein DTL42_14835 [Bremerella cremea]|uniref:Hemerythrin-like domain-containing protein n=1 Tax=Bremerella cremea TaxID=1031537 RepID=A0A368KSB8_9BACT|nr:hypothetical protein [Bremerella cremea]RCS47787.1 hypothetical protein DTL42_14835 [Bremerella cremea]
MPSLQRLTDTAVSKLLTEHALLHELLVEADRVTIEADSAEALILGLQELREMMHDQFAREEYGGYLQETVAIAPRYSSECEQLRHEHRLLLSDIDAMLDELTQDPDGTLGTFHVRFREFTTCFLSHEHHENAVVQKALDDDIGVGD